MVEANRGRAATDPERAPQFRRAVDGAPGRQRPSERGRVTYGPGG